MMVYKFNEIKVLSIEITSICNAKCPGCARLSLTNYSYMDDITWNKLIIQENLQHIKRLIFNGNYGDFICHPKSLYFLSKIYKRDIEIIINTNAGIRSSAYWKSLAAILQTFENHKVIFAIDGTTEETHSNHRQNTKLSKVLKNATTFISHGGNACWSFITFKENEHQIIHARNMAIEYGFKEFRLVNSYSNLMINSQGKPLQALQPVKYLSYLYKYRHSEIPMNKIEKNTDNYNCPWVEVRRLQIDSDGIVYPCCWSAIYSSNILNLDYSKALSIKDYSLQEILKSNFYQKIITDKIQDETSYCNTKCPGKKIDFKIHY